MPETLDELRERADGSSPEEAERNRVTEAAMKRAMLTKSLGEHDGVMLLRQNLAHRIALCDRYLLEAAMAMPSDQASIFAYALKNKEIATRRRDMQWFLDLFAAADAKIINMGKTRTRKK